MKIRLKQNDQIGLIFFIAFVLSTILIYQFEERFDQVKWKERPSSRYKMVDDILDKNLFLNLTKSEVIELLGPPDKTLTNNAIFFNYDIGEEASFSDARPMQLILTFENNRVVKVSKQPK